LCPEFGNYVKFFRDFSLFDLTEIFGWPWRCGYDGLLTHDWLWLMLKKSTVKKSNMWLSVGFSHFRKIWCG